MFSDLYCCEGQVGKSVREVMRKGCEWEDHGGNGYKQAMLLDIERKRKNRDEETCDYIWKLA